MTHSNSLIKFLVDSGFMVFVISWKNPDASMEDTTFKDYLTVGPLSALDIVKEITGSQKVNAVGYCIGGSLLSMALPYSDSFNAVMNERGGNQCHSISNSTAAPSMHLPLEGHKGHGVSA